jgi:hypothetical protein
MGHPVNATYFRSLAVRCLTAARDCHDRRAQDEFRKLADEFTIKANELETPLHLSGMPRARSPERSDETNGFVKPRVPETQ